VKAPAQSALFRRLPSIDDLLRGPGLAHLLSREGRDTVIAAAREVIAELRHQLSAGQLDSSRLDLAIAGIPDAVELKLQRSVAPSLRPVINATGVILHTNLGRAPLSDAAADRVRQVATAYSNLEFDLERGRRGKRDSHADSLFFQLFSRQLGQASRQISTIVVNNNAAAVLLALNTLAEGGEAIVSRGELVEIGGSFRIPEVMAKAGVTLREVGATNRTRLSDYERAINKNTRLLVRVHRSNFHMVGFTGQPSLRDLVMLGRKRKLPVLEDLGSGALFDLRSFGIPAEPTVAESLRAGASVVTYSGDKLLGGPQAGIISGRTRFIARLRSNPLFRALRVDKMTYAALEATLLAYLRPDPSAIPALAMMQLSAQAVRQRALSLAQRLQALSQFAAEVLPGESVIGGGAAPAAKLPTALLAIASSQCDAEALSARLRAATPLPIITRIADGKVILDLRTVFPEQDELIAQALQSISP
jgi:L-seryl-tRNA(Ser) seleniumtransferase